MCPPRTGFSFFLNMSGVTLAAASGPATDQRQQQQQKKSPATILRIYGAANRRERPFISLFGSVQHSRPFFYLLLNRKFHPLSLPFHAARNGQHGRSLFTETTTMPSQSGTDIFFIFFSPSRVISFLDVFEL